MSVYYSENNPVLAQWLRSLIEAGLIADGFIDERSIEDVRAEDLYQYTQCHFFAGLGGWPLAFRMCGWPDTRPCWSGSAPCQPWSEANRNRLGAKDSRHLAPAMVRLMLERRPEVAFGEQVTRAIRDGWLDELFDSLEGNEYTCWSAVLTAAGYGAIHERARCYWLAHSSRPRLERREQAWQPSSFSTGQAFTKYDDPLASCWSALEAGSLGLLPFNGVSFDMAGEITKAFGNAIVPHVAAEFISAYMECRP